MSSMGSPTRSSHQAKMASTTAAAAKAVTVVALAQPLSGASMSPYTSETIPITERTAPTGSSGASFGSLDLGTRNRPAMSATAMIGTLMKKIAPYQKVPSSQPLVG